MQALPSIKTSLSQFTSLPATRHYMSGGRDSSVGIATRWELDGPGTKFRWGQDFSHQSRPALGPTLLSLLYNWYRVPFPGVKRPGPGANHSSSSSAEVKERVELYLCSPTGTSWPAVGGILTLQHHIAEDWNLQVFISLVSAQILFSVATFIHTAVLDLFFYVAYRIPSLVP